MCLSQVDTVLQHISCGWRIEPSSRFRQRDDGVPRSPGGPPHPSCCNSNYLSEAHTQLPSFLSTDERNLCALCLPMPGRNLLWWDNARRAGAARSLLAIWTLAWIGGRTSCAGLRDNESVAEAITRDPETMHGVPVFRGTRVQVQTLFDYLEGGDSLEDFLEGFPTVPRALAVEALEEAKRLLLACT